MTGLLEISLPGALACLVGGFVYSELSGYWLHRLLHSEHVAFLSRNHMIHHLQHYGPEMKQRPTSEYMKSTHGRASVNGLGLEWALPIAAQVAMIYLVFVATGLGVWYGSFFAGAAMLWGYIMFGYIHDSMHVRNFWMAENRLLGRWYRGIRRRHDIHHIRLNHLGRMDRNFGICFYFFDRVFGTHETQGRGVDPAALTAALERYRHVIEDRSTAHAP